MHAPQRYAPPLRGDAPVEMPQVESGRRMIGCGCYTLGMLVGAGLIAVFYFLAPLFSQNPVEIFIAMFVGAVLALPMMIVYFIIPRALDRYDPEPAYALLLALSWGGVAAIGVSVVVNTLVGSVLGEAGAAMVSAPITEEAMKGLLLLGFFVFLRREFDGVVDGIIYGTFVAIGFAAIENVTYYANAGLSGGGNSLLGTFFLRGVLAPWGHPLYTSMTGIGFGIARETSQRWLRFVAPVLGYMGAVFLHFVWNASATVLPMVLGPGLGILVFFLMLGLWLLFVVAFVVMVGFLVRRRGQIIRAHLLDEVALGHLSQSELDLVLSLFGGMVAYYRKGTRGVEFVRTVARLALSKWHSRRAVKMSAHTVSMDFVLPLRKKIQQLRKEGASPAYGPPPQPAFMNRPR